MEDCTVGGYHVPEGTRLLINVWKMHRDPRVWPNPDEFLPERFLTAHKDMDVRGPNFKYIPFGGGRRICPGIYFALQELQMTLATFIQGLEFDKPSGEPIDMSEGIGLTHVKIKPLDVLIKPRLPSHFLLLTAADKGRAVAYGGGSNRRLMEALANRQTGGQAHLLRGDGRVAREARQGGSTGGVRCRRVAQVLARPRPSATDGAWYRRRGLDERNLFASPVVVATALVLFAALSSCCSCLLQASSSTVCH
ncbi:hypothetical protein Tsubulata_001169 [Turnera subulata]|uniref:Cytochrome P450 n=1 Tax=Turnera subulata TaxID=218843 RepID=A0A9Q0GJA7_9ROSI|nr:hypothetical protein Tsubulata_001169 [Turnera subulata]